MLIAHGLPVNDRSFYIHGSLLPHPYPSLVTNSHPSFPPSTTSHLSSLPSTTHRPGRGGKRRRHSHPHRSKEPNMDPTSPVPPPSPLNKAIKWLGKARHKQPTYTPPMTRAASAALSQAGASRDPQAVPSPDPQAEPSLDPQAEPSRNSQAEPSRDSQAELSRDQAELSLDQARLSRDPATEQHGPGSSLFNQVHLPPLASSTFASAFNANTDLVSRPKLQPKSTAGQSDATTKQSQSPTETSNRRSKSPIKSMSDLTLADKPIAPREFGDDITQLPLDVREMCERLVILNDASVEIMPIIIAVSIQSGQV